MLITQAHQIVALVVMCPMALAHTVSGWGPAVDALTVLALKNSHSLEGNDAPRPQSC